MKKTLIASAVAAATISSTAFAADSMANMPTFYGNIQLAYVHTSEETGSTETTTNEFIDNGSTLGVKHEHEIAPGLTGFLKAEWDFDADDKSGGGKNGFDLDEAYIGVKGDFGSAQLGSDDTVYEWWDVIDISEAVGISGEMATYNHTTGAFGGVAEGDNFQYVSPVIAGGLTVGVTIPVVNSDKSHAAALGAKFKTDMFEAIFGYAMGREEDGVDTGDSIGLGGRVFLGDLTLGLQYETRSADSVGGADVKASEADGYGLIAIYAMGASQFAAGYQAYENDADAEADKFYLQALHNISDNMYAYVEYTNGSVETKGSPDTDTEEFAIGATYTF
ncbi:porin [Hahella sp. HN01]|uniref:porin n=1 Tax=Hahella sp. HN01 TaxID=2847262 RepID=UPI001C1E9F2E|nr:porin [Hahella sp. HN01]MBU6951587.1 porin [Hahella sp. HN01]